MHETDDATDGNAHVVSGDGVDLASVAAQRLVAYEEAKAAGTGAEEIDDLVAASSLDAEQGERFARDAACVDLLHRVWPEFEAATPPPTANVRREELPQVLGDFQIVREIAHGGMGVVYEARQISLGRRVALKVLPFAALASEQQVRRFQNEARAAATLQHPHIVPVYAVGREGRVHYYTMQYIDGPSLADVIQGMRSAECGMRNEEEETGGRGQGRNEGHTSDIGVMEQALQAKLGTGTGAADSTWSGADGAPPPGTCAGVTSLRGESSRSRHCGHTALGVLESVQVEYARSRSAYFRTIAGWGVQLADALAYAHENGVLHRDVKPANILLDATGRPWITDFGLARLETEGTLTKTGDLVGTLCYMAPEQARGKRGAVGASADVYSLGVTLYELLTLRPAFRGLDHTALLKQIALNEPRGLRRIDRSIPRDLGTIVRKSMSKDASDRYESAGELAADLQRFLDREPILAKPPGPVTRAVKWGRRRPAAAALVVLTVLAIAMLWAGTRPRAHRPYETGQLRRLLPG